MNCAPPLRIAHQAVWRHRIEIVVMPARAELYFRDERWIDPINTQLRFEATVFNSDRGATWDVVSPSGGGGAGTIDSTGLYQAPDKGGLISGSTDIIVATSRADPLRKAYAWVTLVGLGPLPAPRPAIDIWPKRVSLFYWSGDDNAYIDDSNKLQVFRAFARNTATPGVTWSVTAGLGTLVTDAADPSWCTYLAPDTGQSPNSGSAPVSTVTAALTSDPTVRDNAYVVLRNYIWPNF